MMFMKIRVGLISISDIHLHMPSKWQPRRYLKEILRHGEAVGLGMICEILLTKINKINNNTIVKKLKKF